MLGTRNEDGSMKKLFTWLGIYLAAIGCGAGWYVVFTMSASLVSIFALYTATILLIVWIMQVL